MVPEGIPEADRLIALLKPPLIAVLIRRGPLITLSHAQRCPAKLTW